MALSKELIGMLACPGCKGSLRFNREQTRLVCRGCVREFDLENGIPVLV